MKSNIVGGWLLGSGALLCFATWRTSIPAPLPIHNFVLIDRSGSGPAPCVGLGRIVQRVISSSPRHSSWTFFATGTPETAYEPVPMPVNSSPGSQRLMDGKEQADRANAAFVKDVTETCSKMLVTESSPIFLDAKHVIAQARQHAGKAEVYVYIITDLQELAEKEIALALTQAHGVRSSLPNPIDAHGISLRICGYAETVGRKGDTFITAARTATNTDRLIEVWSSLFSRPTSIEFAPFCF